ncbi:MAG: putative ABC transporter permease [Lachnospiraceae bacterium]|nr:putative ABC transporter permease [Lachnospiraceae bacterium]
MENNMEASPFVKKLIRHFVLWITGGIAYFYIEIIFRGFSHYSMIICGGFCFLLVGEIGVDILYSGQPFYILKIMGLAALVITTLEFFTGIIVNKIFQLGVWDYSTVRGNIMGQVCLPYTFLWGVLGLVCVYITDMIDRFILS